MKLKHTIPLLLLLPLAGPALAQTAQGAALAETCPVVGPMDGATEECRAVRLAFRAELRTCMDRKHAEADARAGRATSLNSHTNRARFIACNAEIRAGMGLPAK